MKSDDANQGNKMTEINMEVDVDEIREIYFRNDEQKYFFGPRTKRESWNLIAVIVAFPFFITNYWEMDIYWYYPIGGILFFSVVYDFCKTAFKVIDWKKSVLKFVEFAKEIQVLKFKYNNDYFIHIQDGKETKLEWSLIDRAVIDQRFIWLFASKDILLPKRSMSKEEFEVLSEVIMERVKSVVKE